MDQYAIKSVTFGGFDKQDVVRYIEQAAEAQKALQEEADDLRKQVSELTEEKRALGEREAALAAECARLREELAQESAARQELEALRPLAEESERLRPDAEAYAQFRERLGAIECEARKRAADLEEETACRMRKTVEQFQSQYQALMSTFETAASHVNGELRKVQVNLTQLPRAMDQTGAELNALAARLEPQKQQ